MSDDLDWAANIDPRLLEEEESHIERSGSTLEHQSLLKKGANNPLGHNGKARCAKPSPELGLVLQGYYNDGMTSWEAIRNRTQQEHGIWLGERSAFFRLTKALGVGTARKCSISVSQLEQVIVNFLEEDPSRGMGYRGMTHQLRQQGLLVGKDTVYSIMRDFDSESLAARQPGGKKLHRTRLNSAGPNEQWSIDGHDKLSGLGFGIYGIRDVFSGRFLALKVMPSNRTLDNALWVYMDTVCKLKGFPVQIASDRGSEVKRIYARQTAFRHAYSDIDCEEHAPYVFLRSVRNITIERSWRGVRERVVDKVKIHVEALFQQGLVRQHNPLHNAVLLWALAPLVQKNLNDHLAWFNSYRVRFQKEKALPSGADRNTMYYQPERWSGVPLLQNLTGESLEHAEQLKREVEEQAGLEWVASDIADICAEAAVSVGVTIPLKSWQGIGDSLVRLIREVEIRIPESTA